MSIIRNLVFILLLVALGGCGACIEKAHIVQAVENQGYSNVNIVGESFLFYEFYGCSGSDAAAYMIAATNALGKRVPLLACAGWPFKGVTVRSR